MPTELVVLNQDVEIKAPVAEDESYEDNGNWGEDEPIQPQFIALRQALSENVDHIPLGSFYHKNSGQVWTTIKMIILSMHKTRALKPSAPAYVQGEKDLCRSNDGIRPVTNDDRLVPQAQFCLPDAKGNAQCPKNSWSGFDRSTGKGAKPLCQKGYFFLFLDEETNLPYIYTPSGQGYDPSVALKAAMKSMADVAYAREMKAFAEGTIKVKPSKPNTYDFCVEMTAIKGNKAYLPKFLSIRRMKPEDSLKFGPLYEQFVKSRKAPITEQDSDEGVGYDAAADKGTVIDAEVTPI